MNNFGYSYSGKLVLVTCQQVSRSWALWSAWCGRIFAVLGPECGVEEIVSPMLHSSYLRSCTILHRVSMTSGQWYCCIWMSSVKWCSVHVTIWAKKRGINVKCRYQLFFFYEKGSPLPRSVILTVNRPLPSDKLKQDISSLKLWLGFELTPDAMDVDSST